MRVSGIHIIVPVLLLLFVAPCIGGQWNSWSACTGRLFRGGDPGDKALLPLLFEETMENGRPFARASSLETGDWNYALQFVAQPVFQGKWAARFEIRDDQPLVKHGKRSEVVVVKGRDGQLGRNVWYSFAAYFPSEGYEYDTTREVINQWYQDGSPATSLRTQGDSFLLETGPTPESRRRFGLGTIEKDRWHEFVFHFVHAHGDEGLIEVWHDGAKVLTHRGGNMYDDVLPKWKIGLYKAAFKRGTSLVHRRVVYFDNIKVGSERAVFRDMIPSLDVARERQDRNDQ
ncbi:polysaccharide lyase [Paraflavisolibacter sp. H34]|uniref:polysaccharide lyase n=1 Tax=Huijunlia imazamoxiresistens TaxID=3127457 RepID=UPI003017B279